MLPYFYQFETELLNRTGRDSLIAFANKHQNTFEEYQTLGKDQTDNNNFLRPKLMPTLRADTDPTVSELMNSISLPHYPMLVMHRPGDTVPRHIDDQNYRNTVLSIPLAPQNDYPPTYYWESLYATTPIAVVQFINSNPCILNTQRIHSLKNTADVHRYNFQICFNVPINVVMQQITNGTFFKQ